MAITNLLDVKTISQRIINQKKSPYHFITIKNTQREEYQNQGWQYVPSKIKKSLRMRKLKAHNIAFEDRVWALMARLQFNYINKDYNFRLEYQPGLTKQLDVFAIDEEAILIIECKSTDIKKRVSYQKDINELVALKEKLRIAAKNIFSGQQKVSFIFATKNAIISDNDRQRLLEGQIFHFTQDDIEYFEQLADFIGFAAKYQLYGKLFEGQKIPELKNRVPAIKGKVSGGHTFYSFSIDPYYLLKIGFVLHRRETNPESANAYQRLIKKTRLKQIGSYINKGGYFPNSIIINIQGNPHKELRFDMASLIEHDSKTNLGVLHLPKTYKSAFIIDGQHRLYGYAVTASKSNHTIPVVAFYNLPVEEQSRIFVDINHTQKSVPANLLHSIMADFHWKSANDREAISALKTRLFVELNSDDRSPFYRRLILSEEKKTDIRCLTLQTLKSWGLNKVEFFGTLKGDRLIKTGYLTDIDYDKTLEKAVQFFNSTFRKIEEDLSDQWKVGAGPGGFIAMNSGVSALIRIMDNIINFLIKNKNIKPELMSGQDLSIQVIPFLDPVVKFIKKLDNEGRNKLRGLFGSGATEKVLKLFQNAIYLIYNEFNPEGLEQWRKDNTGEFNEPAYDIGNKYIEPKIDEFIKTKLREKFGDNNWWIEGIPKNIQLKCAENKIEVGSREPDWNFLNTIHYHKIIEKHWDLFGEYFTMPGMENVKKEKKLDWLNKFNSIRQKYSHPQRENTTEAEYNFLVQIKKWLENSLK